MAQDTPRKPVGKRPAPAGKYPARPITKKQRRNMAAARSVALERRPPWQSPTVVTISSVAVVAVVLIVIVLINAAGGNNATVATPVPQSILSAVTNPSASVVDAVGSGRQPGEMIRLPASAKLVDASGKPMVVYVGAEYCPYCAAERWVMVMWLSRFGTFSNLHEIQSSSTDLDPNTDTFTFYKSSYTSQYIDLSTNEIEDRAQQPLQKMTSQVTNIWTKWNTPPYTQQAGQFPFIDVGGYFSLYSTSYDPATLKNLSWSQIAAKLSNPNDQVTKDIVGNANILTAATCLALGDNPSSVCSSSTIQSIEQGLKTIKTPSV
ncbi:MAG: DUF929 family protein [Candidatus Dormiibacterota bacterium]